MKPKTHADGPRLTLVATAAAPRHQPAPLDPLAVVQALTATLELEPVLERLNGFLHDLVEHRGWSYQPADPDPIDGAPAPEPALTGGQPDRHRLEYALSFEGRAMGMLVLMRGRRFTEDEQQRVESLLGLAAPALRNALRFRQLSRQLERDPMTGLGNRRAFHLQGNQWLADSLRQRRPFSLLTLDLDDFKMVNDRFGHLAGDRLIDAVAATLLRVTRAADLCVRMGGDEFVVLLPGSDLVSALDCAERIRQAVAALAIPLEDGARIAASASIGVATHRPGMDLDALYRQADDALYAAKRAGANRVLAGMRHLENAAPAGGSLHRHPRLPAVPTPPAPAAASQSLSVS